MKTTKLTFTLFLFSFVFLTSAFAQVKEKPEAKVDEKTELNRPNSIEADGEKVTIKDGTTTMVEFVSQGSSGLIHLPSLGTLVSYPGNNLYSSGTDLYWGSSKLGTSGSAAGWTDSGTNIYNTTLTDNVGIGTNNPLSKLSVGGDGSDEIVISAFTSNASGGIGVYGYSATDSQIGVSGYNNSTGIGVRGSTAIGTGVKGISYSGIGVIGEAAELGAVQNYGGFFTSAGNSGRGVYAQALGVNAFAGYFNGRGFFDGNVGIGLAISPAYKLDVSWNEAANFIARFENTSTGINADGIAILINATTPGTGNHFIRFQKSGGAGIGSIDGNGSAVFFNTTSDARLKMNIKEYSNALETLSNIGIKKYERIANPGIEEIGVIAQELQKVYPQAVSGSPNSDVNTDPMMVDYSKLTPLLVKGMQEQQEKISSQNVRIKELEERLAKLESLLDGKRFTSVSN